MCRKLIFLTSLVFVLGLAGNASAELVAYYTFNDGTARDSAGYYANANGTFYGDPNVISDPNRGMVLNLDGDGDYVKVENNVVADFSTESFTYAFWAKTAVGGTTGWFYSWKGIYDPVHDLTGVSIYHDNGPEIRFTLYQQGKKVRTNVPDANFVTDEWVHVAALRDADANELRFYYNAKLEPGIGGLNPVTDTVGNVSNTGYLYIGANDRGTPDLFFPGLMDDFRVYNHALSEEELELLYLMLMIDDPNLASMLNPRYGTRNVLPDVVLNWKPGRYADLHDVYFGTDFEDVNNATDPYTAPGRGRQDPNWYDPPGLLEFGETYYWRIDEVNDACAPYLWKGVVWKFTVDNGKARNPNPSHYARDVPRDVVLSWGPGPIATSHDVYFCTDWADVNDATDPNMLPGRGRQEPNSYDAGSLETLYPGVTYYWRIDEVSATTYVKGDVWSFTVAEFIVVDDMESYNLTDNWIDDTWLDGFDNGTGSEVTLGIDPYEPVHRGKQSMVYVYQSDGGYWGDLDYYSEVEREFSDPCDWTVLGMKALTLFFYGKPDNDANEQMYVVIEDSTGADSNAQINYGYYGEDMNDIKKEEWQDWNIELKDLTTVDLNSVKKVYIGFGIRGNLNSGGTPGGSGKVYFDNVRLYMPRCIPENGPVADFSGNCIVDLADVGIMADEWLRTDAILAKQAPNPAGLVGWWKLDDGDGSTATDSSDYDNHGTITGEYSWVADHNAGWALDFEEGVCKVPDAVELRPAAQVSASAWINYSVTQGAAPRLVVKGADNWESYCIELSGNDSLRFYVRDTNGTSYNADSPDDALERGEWIHLAGTYDGSLIKCYVNGQVVGDNDEAIAILLSQDVNDFGIGNRPDDEARPYNGTIDEVRVYNYGLSAAEVAWLATDGTGYVPLRSQANIFDKEQAGEQAINLRDYAMLMESWLEKKYWPE